MWAGIPKELETTFTDVDNYYSDLYIPADPVLEEALKASDAGGLPQHNVAPNQGKFLQLLTQIHGAKTILEIGTLGAYSTIWFARGLPATGGKIITLEFNPAHAAVAQANIERAKLSDVIEVRVGPATESLQKLVDTKHPPFDLIFIDADKVNNFAYFDFSLKLSRSGTVIIADNTVRNGLVLDSTSTDSSVKGIRRFNEIVAKDSRVTATTLQTVGSKGYDGFTLLRVL